MSFLRELVSTVTGTFTGVAAGGAVNGNAVMMGGQDQKVRGLSALVSVTALTNTITLTPRWQVSADNTTWYTCANGSQNAASVALATGVTPQTATPGIKMYPAPEGVAGWKFARVQVVVGVVTGTTGDTYSIQYSYRQQSPGDNS